MKCQTKSFPNRFQQFIYDPSFWKQRHFIFFDFAARTDSLEAALNHEAEEYVWTRLEKTLRLPLVLLRVSVKKIRVFGISRGAAIYGDAFSYYNTKSEARLCLSQTSREFPANSRILSAMRAFAALFVDGMPAQQSILRCNSRQNHTLSQKNTPHMAAATQTTKEPKIMETHLMGSLSH